MAYELLGLGYTILYKPVANNDFSVLKQESFWEIFKDKANYDFRFITHGLLKGSEKNEALYAVKFGETNSEMSELQKAIDVLTDCSLAGDEGFVFNETDPKFEKAEACENRYSALLAAGDLAGISALVDPESADTPKGVYSSYNSACEAILAKYIELKTDKDIMDGGVIDTALINAANAVIANVAAYLDPAVNKLEDGKLPGRGDCIALVELCEDTYTKGTGKAEARIISAIANLSNDIDGKYGKYSALTVPSVCYNKAESEDDPFDNNAKFPAAFHYLACFRKTLDLGFKEWYATAGYTRGVSKYTIDHTTVQLGEIAINALEPRNIGDTESNYPKFACNVIANFRGSYYLWGNRTAHPLGKAGNLTDGDLVASHFLNIRQLCATIKKQLYVSCRRFTFDPNSDTLWFNFVNSIRPTLELMKADQGIRDYKILKESTDKKATLKAKIKIVPIEAVEDFDLEIILEDSFGETAATVTD